MLIVCPSCATAYRIELGALGAAGRSVRCARCRHVWFASLADLGMTALPIPASQTISASADDHEPRASAMASDDHHADDLAEASGAGADVLPDDAAPATIENAPSLVPQDHPPAIEQAAGGSDIETLAARRERRKSGASKRRIVKWPSLPAIIAGLAILLAALLSWRSGVVQILPQTASLFSAVGLPVNIRGLSLDNVKTSVESHEGVMVLLVEGTITNLTRAPQDVPRLRFAVRNDAGYEVYAWTALPAQPVLAPGDTAPFRARLASPPADSRQIIVRFFNRHDAAGTN